jgi:hypothetical protein
MTKKKKRERNSIPITEGNLDLKLAFSLILKNSL